MIKPGMVYLVGAGPGDEGLITVTGARLLSSCDCIIYDHLASEAFLDYGKEGCEKIFVGKEKGRHSKSQEETNRLLIQKAASGAVVVRLKGGDPYVFGRGGEEVMALREAGIPYEVVPGISSAVAALSSAGIPITHRGLSRGFQVITGHAGKDGRLPGEFYQLREWGGTTVFLMGISRLEEIGLGLMKQGWRRDTPAAVIENGTLPSQRRVSGTLSDIWERAKEAKIKSPAVIVVGQTAALDLRQPELPAAPLAGVRIGIVGTDRFYSRLEGRLKSRGASVRHLCRMKLLPLGDPEIQESFRELNQYTWLVFTSANGVRLYLEGLFSFQGEGKSDLRSLGGLKIAAIGKGTAQALEGFYLRPDYVPEVFSSHQLALGLAGQMDERDRVLIPRALQGTKELPERLKERGIFCKNLPIYDVEPELLPSEETGGLGAEPLDVIVFASASGVRGFSPYLGKVGGAKFCCIGEITAKELTAYGCVAHGIAGESSAEGILEQVLKMAKKNSIRIN